MWCVEKINRRDEKKWKLNRRRMETREAIPPLTVLFSRWSVSEFWLSQWQTYSIRWADDCRARQQQQRRFKRVPVSIQTSHGSLFILKKDGREKKTEERERKRFFQFSTHYTLSVPTKLKGKQMYHRTDDGYGTHTDTESDQVTRYSLEPMKSRVHTSDTITALFEAAFWFRFQQSWHTNDHFLFVLFFFSPSVLYSVIRKCLEPWKCTHTHRQKKNTIKRPVRRRHQNKP